MYINYVAARVIESCLAIGILAACTLHAQPNSDCQWPSNAPQRSLARDAEFAEDLAIRYADTHVGAPGGRFQSWAEARNQCLAKLLPPIARAHGVTAQQTVQSISERPAAFDFAVMFSFALLYTLAAVVAARWLSGKFVDGPADPAGIMMTLYVAPVISLAGVLIGEAWTLTAAGLRLRTGHLSYRVSRIPWSHHRLMEFAAGVAIVWILPGWFVRRRWHGTPLNSRLLNSGEAPG